MACPHLSAAFMALAPPRPSQHVQKEECTLCFDDQDGPNGIDVCLLCFNGGCTGNSDREHSRLHFEKTQHSLVVNIRRTRRPAPPAAAGEAASVPKKLAIAAESDADRYDYHTVPRCLACDPGGTGKNLPLTDKLGVVIRGVMTAMSSAQQSEVKAWEEEIVPCQHTRELVQPGSPTKLELSSLASCGKCDLTSNLWLCLTCGHLGCGRAQFGGMGGNSHGLSHFEESGHPVSVKQGTITAEGSADIYCYACNDARIDPSLASHLSHFDINVMDLSKTEKSMTELQIEQNLKFDFNMTGEDGKSLEPMFGPGLTGIRNLGNSCYMASVLQSLFALPAWKKRYGDSYRPHTLVCGKEPANCFECQMGKVADGLLSGRYSRPRDPEQDGNPAWTQKEGEDQQHQQQPLFQQGVRPNMFKALVGKGHEEFSTMRQQDADEFLKYLVGVVQKENRKVASTGSAVPTEDPTNIFGFGLEQRLECNECHKVRYTVERQDAGLSLPVPIREKPKAPEGSPGKQPAEGVHAAPATSASDGKVEYEPVSLQECLDILTAPEELENYHCPSCTKRVTATKRTLFATFPQVLALQVRRFQLINWVPQKVPVPIIVPLNISLNLDRYLGKGKQEHEVELPEDDNAAAASDHGGGKGGAGGEPEWDMASLSQLTSMGFPEIRCKKAILATGMGDAETAMNWLFAHMEDADVDDPIDFSASSAAVPSAGAGANGGGNGPDTSMLEDMGFSKNQARKALRLNSGNPELAVAWLFENPDDAGEESAPTTASAEKETVGETSESGAGTGVNPGNTDLPAKYNIKSFISHNGPSVHSGHYVAHVKQSQAQQQGSGGKGGEEDWVFFNDEKVVKAPYTCTVATKHVEEDSGVKGLSSQAYVYFFERV
ncbi:related to ubiquitin-specific processing protease [Melanopsichium pennsylvanicum]|uniref:ubiquitinyl hydrolase 1 n=2 Tax=Melanopsichium pennsylvanicum TaxID=63383 RepID=A0AAJ4XGI5_9BASI|nr:related to ubiquitin-specific processing protease [Melanopsichium pennsylvanicum 4]SNX81610.1 related to ubiquitin-specific processing protease [Melanopsichium pennsylvanicum]